MLAAPVHVFALNPALGTGILRLSRPSVPATAPMAAAAPDLTSPLGQRRRDHSPSSPRDGAGAAGAGAAASPSPRRRPDKRARNIPPARS